MSVKQLLFSQLGKGQRPDETWAEKSKAARAENARKLRELVLKKAAEVFPHEDVSDIVRLLDQYGVEPLEGDCDRVHLAILKLSEGQLDKLEHYIKVAKADYRDVLMPAEYPLAQKVGWTEMEKMDSQSVEQLRQKDREQYLEWLNS